MEQHLDFLCLLLLLLTLGFLDGGSSLRDPVLCTLVPLRKDGGQISTDDATLVLHGLSRAFLRNFFRDTLLMKAAVGDGP